MTNGTQFEKEQWRKAIHSEFASLEENGTWSVCDLPKGRKAIRNKWVFRIKQNSDGEVEKFKARNVSCGYSQIKDVDYNETFAPVV